MKAEFIPKVITLLAGAVVCIVAIVKQMDVTYSLEVLLATLIVFYIIGIIAQKIILKVEQSNRFIRSKRDEELREQEKEQLLSAVDRAMEKVVNKMLFGLRDSMNEQAFLECVAGLEKTYEK